MIGKKLTTLLLATTLTISPLANTNLKVHASSTLTEEEKNQFQNYLSEALLVLAP